MPTMVRMRDGVRLATDVYLDGRTEPGPTILIRTPYDKRSGPIHLPYTAEYMAERGYRVVTQDNRGKFESEGVAIPFGGDDVADAYDTIDWIVQQPWSDGKVGMFGDSYYGYTAMAGLSSRHPALRAISPRVTGSYLAALNTHAPDAPTRDVEWSFSRLYGATYYGSQYQYVWDMDWKHRPLADNVEGFFKALGRRFDAWDQVYLRNVERRRWPEGMPWDAPPIPVLQSIGWWDVCAPWAWQDVAEFQSRPAWATNHYLNIESIDHTSYEIGTTETKYRTLDEVKAFLPRHCGPTLEFFDVFIRGIKPADSIPRVRWNLAHTEGMRTSASWPPDGVLGHTVHLTAGGALSDVRAADETVGTWTHDPEDPIPSRGDIAAFEFVHDWPDEAPEADRNDVLSVIGPVLDSGLNIVGPVRFDGNVWSSGPNMDVLVRLLDVQPNGERHLISRGMSHVKDASQGQSITIEMAPTGYWVRPGHRLAVHLASSDFPDFLAQPGTGEDPWAAVETAVNQQYVLLGGEQGARVSVSTLEEPGPVADRRW